MCSPGSPSRKTVCPAGNGSISASLLKRVIFICEAAPGLKPLPEILQIYQAKQCYYCVTISRDSGDLPQSICFVESTEKQSPARFVGHDAKHRHPERARRCCSSLLVNRSRMAVIYLRVCDLWFDFSGPAALSQENSCIQATGASRTRPHWHRWGDLGIAVGWPRAYGLRRCSVVPPIGRGRWRASLGGERRLSAASLDLGSALEPDSHVCGYFRDPPGVDDRQFPRVYRLGARRPVFQGGRRRPCCRLHGDARTQN